MNTAIDATIGAVTVFPMPRKDSPDRHLNKQFGVRLQPAEADAIRRLAEDSGLDFTTIFRIGVTRLLVGQGYLPPSEEVQPPKVGLPTAPTQTPAAPAKKKAAKPTA